MGGLPEIWANIPWDDRNGFFAGVFAVAAFWGAKFAYRTLERWREHRRAASNWTVRNEPFEWFSPAESAESAEPSSHRISPIAIAIGLTFVLPAIEKTYDWPAWASFAVITAFVGAAMAVWLWHRLNDPPEVAAEPGSFLSEVDFPLEAVAGLGSAVAIVASILAAVWWFA